MCVFLLLLLFYIGGRQKFICSSFISWILNKVKLYYLKYSLTFARLWYNNLQTMAQDIGWTTLFRLPVYCVCVHTYVLLWAGTH